ncbi:MAG: hypothetical protein QOE38_1317 [Thermoleophilaceae bacterium]|nr:hypothetical protein [Thermoleophilaceae bacterium]
MRVLRAALLSLLLSAAAAGPVHSAKPPPSNRISAENALPGTTRWDITPPAKPAIEGYASEASVQPGRAFHLHVAVRDRPGNRYRVIVYRLGWYGGDGGRQMTCIPGCDADERPVPQPAAPPPAATTGIVRAGWSQTDVVHVGRDWVSGYYLAQLRVTAGPDEGAAGRIQLVVRAAPDNHAAVLVQVPVNTWQAYNPWGGKSLYTYNSTDRRAATHVSIDRPYSEDVLVPVPWSVELPALRFIEREGVDVSYVTDADIDRSPRILLSHRLVLSLGHDEYWSAGQRRAWDVALARSTNLAAMGANTAYAKVRYEDGRRTIARVNEFRSLRPRQPECRLFGVMYAYNAQRPATVAPSAYALAAAAGDPWLIGTGLTRGDDVPGVVGYEWDTLEPGCFPGPVTRLLHASLNGEDGRPHPADAVRGVDAQSGARVFASGSIQFAWALDGYGDHLPSRRIQVLLENALYDLTRPAAPAPLEARAGRSGTALEARRPPDPRVRRVAIYVHGGRARFELQDPGVKLVCRPLRGRCRDRRRAGLRRYAAVSLDRWGSSAPAYSKAVGVQP